MLDEIVVPEGHHIKHALGLDKSTHVAARKLVKKDCKGNTGEVSAEDIQNDSEYLAMVSQSTIKPLRSISLTHAIR